MKNNSKLKVGIVTTWFERGAAMVSKAYMESLQKKTDVFIYARGGEHYAKGDPSWNLKNVTWGKRKISNRPLDVDKVDFFNWIEKNKIDVVLFNEQQSWDIVIECKRKNLFIGSYVDYYTDETVPFFDLFDFLLCNTKRHFSVFKKHRGAIYIPWGTDVKKFKPANKKKFKKDLVFFHSAGVGGKVCRKGTDFLIKAFNKIDDVDTKLVVHSQTPVVNYSDEIQNIVSKNKKIIFITKTVSAPGLYYMGDVYVYPTRLEGIGLTIIEALSSGLRVVLTNEPPMNEFVRKNNSYLVDVSKRVKREDGYFWDESIISEESLLNGLKFYIVNKQKLPKFKKNARNHALKNLSWEINSKNAYDLILDKFKRNHSLQKDKSLNNIISKIDEYQNRQWPNKSLLTKMRDNYISHRKKGYTHWEILKRYVLILKEL